MRKTKLQRMRPTLIMGAIGLIIIGVMYFTTTFDKPYKYVRMDSGQEFHDPKIQWSTNGQIRINGDWYYQFDIDTIY